MPLEKSQTNIIYPKVGPKDVLSAFWQGIRLQKWLMFVLIASIILANIIAVITPIFYKQFFDVITTEGDRTIVARQLFALIAYILILNIFFWIFYRIATLSNNVFQPMTIAKLKQRAYDYLMQHSYSFFTANFTGSLVQRVNRFARAFERLSDRFTWDLLPLATRAVFIFIVVFFVNKWIAFVILVWVAFFLAFNIIFSRWKVKYDVRVAEVDSKATGYLADTITNQSSIQFFNGFGRESKGYGKVTDEQAKITRFSWNLDAVIESGQALLSFAIEFILFFLAIKYWQQGLITVGVFVMLQTYLIFLIHQLWGFTRIIRDGYQGYADSKEMVEILLLPHEIKDVPLAKELVSPPAGGGKIEFNDLSFNFNETKKVLDDINVEINPGEKVALVGPSGAGKTTLVRLLLRLYSPTSGKILIDGQNISQVTQNGLRKNISMVPQDPILFHRTLAENIAYGKPDASRDEIKKAAELAHCDEFIKDLPFGFETYVGERGIKLSGGERQRVAIARAILKNAPILVLDEATSSLDSHSEMLIQDALNNLMQGKTTIVIAHRLSTIQKMDRIIVIDQGKIVEQGSHQDLLNKEGSLYKKLWELQAGGFLKSEEEQGDEELITEEAEDSDDSKSEAKIVNF